jgi:hypothetical protein
VLGRAGTPPSCRDTPKSPSSTTILRSGQAQSTSIHSSPSCSHTFVRGTGSPRSARKRRKRSSSSLRVMPAARASAAEDSLENGGPPAAGVARDESSQGCGVGETERFRLLDGTLELGAVQDCREIQQRSSNRGGWDAVDLGDVVGGHFPPVGADALPALPDSEACDLGANRVSAPEAPQHGRGAVAQHCVRAAGQNPRPSRLQAGSSVADRRHRHHDAQGATVSAAIDGQSPADPCRSPSTDIGRPRHAVGRRPRRSEGPKTEGNIGPHCGARYSRRRS